MVRVAQAMVEEVALAVGMVVLQVVLLEAERVLATSE